MSKRVNIFSNFINYRVYHSSFYCATLMHSADYSVARCLSVRLSVRLSDVCLSVCRSVSLSYAGILSKRLNISSNYATAELLVFLVFPYQTLCCTGTS